MTMLILDGEPLETIDGALAALLAGAGVRRALVLLTDGRVLASAGGDEVGSMEELAALIAGNFASIAEISRHIDALEFTDLLLMGQKKNILSVLVDAEAILTVFFESDAETDSVRERSQACAETVSRALDEARRRSADAGPDEPGPARNDDTQERLDYVLGEDGEG